MIIHKFIDKLLIGNIRNIVFWFQNKKDDVNIEGEESEEPADFIGAICADDPQYQQYLYEIEHYGAGYHDELRKKVKEAEDRLEFLKLEEAARWMEIQGIAAIEERERLKTEQN